MFPSGHPSKYWLGSTLLNFSDRTRTGVFSVIWPLAKEGARNILFQFETNFLTAFFVIFHTFSYIFITFGRFQRIFRGLARTQIPTNKNCAPELPTFGVIAGVSYPEVQWNSLALGELPWWSQLTPTPGKYAYHLSFSDLHGRLANTSLLNRLHFLLLLPPKSWCCRVFGLKIILLWGRVKNWAHNLWDWGQLFYLKKDLTVQHSPCLPCEAPWCLPSALVLCRLEPDGKQLFKIFLLLQLFVYLLFGLLWLVGLWGSEPILAVLQYQANSWTTRSKLLTVIPLGKIRLISKWTHGPRIRY